MPSFNRKVENFSQLLGESYFTRNQAFYFVLLAIKNAFSLDETRNLQKLRKRGNNAAWNFARMGNKVRKILDVAQTLQEQFPKASGIKLGKGMLPYVMTGLLLFMPSQFQKAAHAGDIKEGPKLALNTKAPVLPEKSGTIKGPALFKKTSVPTEGKEAWIEASEYAMTHPVISIAIYGRSPDASASELAKIYEDQFKLLGIQPRQLKFYFSDSDRMGAKVGFYLKGQQYGPTDLPGSVENTRQVAGHFPQAWPDSVASISSDPQPHK